MRLLTSSFIKLLITYLRCGRVRYCCLVLEALGQHTKSRDPVPFVNALGDHFAPFLGQTGTLISPAQLISPETITPATYNTVATLFSICGVPIKTPPPLDAQTEPGCASHYHYSPYTEQVNTPSTKIHLFERLLP